MESQDLGKASQPAYRAGSPPYKQALNGVTFVPRKLMTPEGPIFTECFEIRKYQTSYWDINMKAHWRGFIGILNPKAVFPLKFYRLPQHVCQSNYHAIVEILP